MRNYGIATAAAAACALLLAGCSGGSDYGSTAPPTNPPPPPPPPPLTASFEDYTRSLAQVFTCDHVAPNPVGTIAFTFASDQDTAPPRDLTGVATSCQ